jgi:hypothetical protein
MDRARYNRWKRASFALLQVEPFLTQTLQQLGRIDASLYQKDIRFREIRTREDAGPGEWDDLVESTTLAYLWVLGAYEVVRTIDQRCRELRLQSIAQCSSSSIVKHSFERVRIPLAKLEPANRHKASDTGFAYPTLNSTHGIGWKVADEVVISRGALSSELLEFLESFKPGN